VRAILPRSGGMSLARRFNAGWAARICRPRRASDGWIWPRPSAGRFRRRWRDAGIC